MKKSTTVSIEITLTAHAIMRGKERMGLAKDAFEKMALKAFVSGTQHNQTKGELKKYISRLYLQYRTANNCRVHGQFIYLFQNNSLITVYHVPNDLKKYLTIK